MYVLYIPGNCMLLVVVIFFNALVHYLKVKIHYISSHFTYKHQNKRKSTKRIENKENEEHEEMKNFTFNNNNLDCSTLKYKE